MSNNWEESWTEVWSAGDGRDRSYCGIAETDDGFAVDVFQGDTCVASSIFESHDDAIKAASRMRARYLRNATFPTPRVSNLAQARTH